ncbi:MAG TPA: cysteine hydrolase [Candidatus Limnocylindrales bacterium]|nr:cysteine hydrolase [Candidatus Limnocylindrales bacterium]
MIRWAGMEILEQFAEVIEPKHTGLLLWNVSAAAIGRCFNGATMLTNTKALVGKARERGVRILYSKPGPVDWKSVGAPMIRMRMKQMRLSDPNSLKISSSGETVFAQGLEPEANDIVFEEFLPNAFLGTSFEWWLRKYRLKTLVLAGASIETGIDGTARDALNLGYYTVIVRDCVGSQFKDTYDAALLSLERIFDIVDSKEILREW